MLSARSKTEVDVLLARSLKGYVADALFRSNDDSAVAQELLIEWAHDDEHLRIMLLKAGAAQLIRSYYGDMRRSASSANDARIVSLPHAEGVRRTSARIARRDFWDRYTLFGMKPLRSSTKPELLESVRNRREQARGNITRANFEEKISNRLNTDQTVQDRWLVVELVTLANKCGVKI